MKLVALILAVLVAQPAFADLQIVPKWQMQGDKACYTLEGAKQLVLLDKELVEARKLPRLLEDLKLAVDDEKLAVKELQNALQTSRGESLDLRAKLSTCVSERASCEAEKHSTSWVWSVLGGLVVFVGGGVAGYYLATH